MANITISTVNEILREDVDPMLRDLHLAANKSPMARIMKEGRNAGEGTTEFANGSTSYIVARYGKHSGVRSQGEASTLPQGETKRERMSFVPKIINGSFRITLLTIQGTKKKEGSIVNELMDESEQMLQRAQIQMARQAHGDGTGQLALVNDGTPNTKTTVTLDNVCVSNLADIIQEDDELLIGTSAELTGTGSPFSATVASVDSNTQMTIDETTSGCANDDIVTFKDSYVSAAYTEKSGIRNLLVSTGTVQGLDTATRLWLKSNIESTGEALTKRRILQYLMKTASYAGGDNYAVILGDLWYYSVELFVGTPQPDPQRVANLFHGGAQDLQIHWVLGSAPLVFDPLAFPASVSGIDLNNYGYRQLYELSLIEDGENMIHRVSGSTVYEVACSEAGNYYVLDPKTCFRLTAKTVGS